MPCELGTPCCPKTDRRVSCGLPIVVVQHPAEVRAIGDLAICPVDIRGSNPAVYANILNFLFARAASSTSLRFSEVQVIFRG
jgi:hypothetical protein